jgi:uncharacterized membrane protein YkvA (DUF1232 family)
MHKQLSGRLFSNWFSNLFRQAVRNPKYRLWMIAGSLVYLLSPLDISPDVFPVLGWIDDGVVVTLLATEVSQLLLERRKLQKEKTITVESASSVS